MNSCVHRNSSFPSLKLNVFYLGALMSCYVVLEHHCDFVFNESVVNVSAKL